MSIGEPPFWNSNFRSCLVELLSLSKAVRDNAVLTGSFRRSRQVRYPAKAASAAAALATTTGTIILTLLGLLVVVEAGSALESASVRSYIAFLESQAKPCPHNSFALGL